MTLVQEGEVLAGKYRVERVLGVGGMGVVVAAHHIGLDERVAIKFLLPEALANPEAVARFAREARAAVKIKSLHVARVSDVGVLDTGAPYMVMEYLQGQDLSQRLRDHGPLGAAETVDLVLQACEALAEAHALGMVHRDLKPANLFLTQQADGSPCVKVLDFGISKVTSPGSSGNDFGMTKTQAVMGSPLYMSPEQMASSRDVDARADIWAIGTILFELLTGRVPFLGDTMPQLCAMILQEAPPPPRHLRPDLPDGLQQVVLRCLEKDKNRRFSNVGELASALVPFGSRGAIRSAERVSRVLSAAGISSSQLNLGSSSPPVVEAATQANFGKTGAVGTHRALFIGLTSFAALALTAGVLAWRYLGTPTPEESTAVVTTSTATHPAAPAVDAKPGSPPSAASGLGAGTSAPIGNEPSVAASSSAAPEVPATSATTSVAVRPAVPVRPRPAPAAKPTATSKPTRVPKPTATVAKPAAPAIDPLAGRR
jgi:serine/threonine-protein kinase